MIASRTHIKVSLGYFLLAALLGVLLRTFVVATMPINYRFMVHTHSHIALLGWVYIALTTLLYHLFLDKGVLDRKYRRIFWFTQICLLGMLLSFPFQGYALFSIIFSTLFLLASYWFSVFFIKYVPLPFKGTKAYSCVKYALWFMVGSSIGPWSLGAIMTVLGPESIWYRLAIYFYLHFQYNGWMVMALLGLFFYLLEQLQINISQKTFRYFFLTTVLGIILSFFLSTLWTGPPMIYYLLGGLGAVLQLMGFGILLNICLVNKVVLKSALSPFRLNVLKLVAFLLLVKMMLQWLTAWPYFANLAATILDFTIGYLHWTFLGVISMGLLFFLEFFGLIRLSKTASALYLLGFLLTEILIFYRGMAAWMGWPLGEDYSKFLAGTSILIPLAVLVLLGHSSKGNGVKAKV
ncbi:hypothetical protein [Arenibacter sp. ARW7G5Y1]|uniref:hypothetical protein n=1 Tax=Arenibacter sp. ARW7G5Y1 TaxID=2135619 RepID=UPI000D75F93D|nr:hypothetical protein [Arenibacter sp. ARW7G5Y1]PXX25137.1 hypothetical protein C7972_11314 [Arenibacter sp. ARW7G5Y1]